MGLDLGCWYIYRMRYALPISILFNKSMSEGKVPEDWRRANIVPIFKAGSRNKPENFRPVSLTSQVCKLFESLLRDDIVDHLERKRSAEHLTAWV